MGVVLVEMSEPLLLCDGFSRQWLEAVITVLRYISCILSYVIYTKIIVLDSGDSEIIYITVKRLSMRSRRERAPMPSQPYDFDLDDDLADELIQELGMTNNGPSADVRILQREIKALKQQLHEGGGYEALIRDCCRHHYERPPELIMPPAPKLSSKGTVQIAIAHVTDTQLGKQTMDYDAVIGAQRLHKYARKVVEITEVKRNGSRIDELRLYLGGDMVEGETGNYPSQPYDVHSSVIRQAMREAPDMFEAMIYYLLKYFKKIHILGVPGNHGRGASRHATRHNETNWDRVFYWTLRDRVIGSDLKPDKQMRKRVTFEIPEGDKFWVLDRVWGWGNLIVHGDQIRGWSGIPYYGVQKKTHGWADSMPHDWDNLFFGHFHQHASGTINYRRWFGTGSTESSNNYALEQLASAGPPSQRLLFMTKKNGVISDHQIFLEDDRLPIMDRKLKQAITEYGPDQIKRMLQENLLNILLPGQQE